MFLNIFGYSQDFKISNDTVVENTKDKYIDSLSITTNSDNKNKSETNSKLVESNVNDSIVKNKGFLEGIVNYKAKDYTSVNQKTKQIFLYNEAQIQYKDMDIQSGVIIID